MKKYLKKLVAMVLCMAIMICCIPTISANAMSESDFNSKINQLKGKYQNYSRWTSSFDGGTQCYGFARLIAYEVYGSKPSTWQKVYSIDGVKAGDVLQYGPTTGSGHTVFVTNVLGNTITFVDCNGNGNYNGSTKVRTCGIKWDNTVSKYGKMFGRIQFSYLLSSPGFSNPNPPILPTTIDNSWKVPANFCASHRITTYNEYGEAESNHYIDPGDNCYITEVYTNGFVKVQYPVPSGKRWAYAKASDFSLEPQITLPDTKLQAWFSTSAMGGTANGIRLNDLVYLCYRLETQDGKLLDGTIGNYTVKETIFFPDGSTVPYSYAKSNNNWIRSNFTQWGTYRGVVEISGDYTGKVEVSYTISKPKNTQLSSWFSASKMGNEVSSMEKGKFYYLCYSIKADNDYLNKIANCEYSVTEEVYGPDGKKVHTYTYDKSDNNWIGFTATQSGTYKGIVTIKGHPSGSDTTTCVCKDTSTPTLKSIDIVQYPKLDYEIGNALDLRGMVVKAYYSNKSYKTITNYRVDGDITKVGLSVITISYTEGGITKTAQFTVNVKEKTPQTVTITYNSCGGNWEQKQQQVKKGGKTTLLSGTPGKKYKITLDANGGVLSKTSLSADALFLGWYTQKGGKGQHYSSGESVCFEQNITLYAAYGSAKIGTLPVPSRSACVFDGWYMENGAKVSSNTMISDDCTLTAKWQLKEPVHQSEDKSKQLTSISVTSMPQKTSYFLSEPLDITGMKVTAVYSDGSKREVVGWQISGSTDQSGSIPIRVEYAEGGKTAYTTFVITVKQRREETITITYHDYNGNMYGTPARYASNQSFELMKEYPDIYCRIQLDPDGGSLSQSSVAVSAPFLGWYTSKGAQGNKYEPGQRVSFISSIDLYAGYGEKTIGTLPQPYKEGYIFKGWYTKDDGKQITTGASISDGCELVAKWEKKEIEENEKTQENEDKQDDELGNYEDPEESDTDDPVGVGDEITTDKSVYTVTMLGNVPCVEYSELFDDEVTKEIIPDTITVDGVTYLVTSVGEKAFYKNVGVKQVTIGKNVTEIGSKAFYGCSSLSKLIIKTDKLKSGSIGSNAFARVAKNVKVYVPGTKYSTYKKILKKAGIGSKSKIYKKK